MDKTYEFRILKINLERKNIVVSRRDLIEESRHESRRKVLADIQVDKCGCVRGEKILLILVLLLI